MLFTALAILAYRRRRLSGSNLGEEEEEEEKDWRKRLAKELENLPKEMEEIREELRRPLEQAFWKCYSPDMEDHEEEATDDMTQTTASQDTATSFRTDVRNEWIQAVFGRDFPYNNTASGTQQGVGLAKIPAFTAYTVRVPPNPKEDKLGITLSRLALGLYVRKVRVGSEAWCAGIIPNSVLVDINGLSLLAEPSKQALERIWLYEGIFRVKETAFLGNGSNKNRVDTCSPIDHPVTLTLIHKGHLYKATLLSNPPYGIDWSPCGNFALVKRVTGYGAKVGIKRGAIVAKVNEKTLHDMDHTDCATELRDLFERGQRMELKLCFTPSEARSGHFERQQQPSESPETKTGERPEVMAHHEGVEVRVHPIFGHNNQDHFYPSSEQQPKISKLASRVAEGEIVSLPKAKATTSSLKSYLACPTLESLLEYWGQSESLLYLMKFHQAGYDERKLSMRRPYEHQLVNFLSRSNLQVDFIRMFMLPLVCFRDEDSLLLSLLVGIANSNRKLAHQMELVAQALGNEALKTSLFKIRMEKFDFGEDLKGRLVSPNPKLLEQAIPLPDPTSTKTTTNMEPPPDSEHTKQSRTKGGLFRRRKKTASRNNMSTITNSSQKSPTKQSKETLLANSPAEALSTTAPAELPPDALFCNTLSFLEELDAVCSDIEKSLLMTFSQKVASWALQPWSASKETALAQVTQAMRKKLTQCRTLPLLNPIDSKRLVSLDPQGCYILPSAHFPLLLTFDCEENQDTSHGIFGKEEQYRTKVELVQLRGPGKNFVVHGCVAGMVLDSEKSVQRGAEINIWDDKNVLVFDSQSTWGKPQTLALRISESTTDEIRLALDGKQPSLKEVGYSWVDLAPIWKRGSKTSTAISCQVWPAESLGQFDEYGDLPGGLQTTFQPFELELRVTTEVFHPNLKESSSRKRSLLYKHDDDVEQEMFAIEFVKSCDKILKSCGLDLKLLTFGCIPVGKRRGFIEWVPGSVPLSEICQPFANSIIGRRSDLSVSSDATKDEISSVARAGLTKYESLHRLRSESRKEAMSNNPIQDYLRSFAYDKADPYMIRKDVMDAYVKSCAGYCVITYLLGVGDRHLDNLLLHQTGHFFHCDYSFILGQDPKKYLPVRMTESMVDGMGGRDSDNFAKFLSLTCAAYLTLRRPENVRHLLSLIRLMEGCSLPDVEENQSIDAAILGLRERFRLDLNEVQAISFMEKLIEESCSSKMWMAVDAIHTLGKRF